MHFLGEFRGVGWPSKRRSDDDLRFLEQIGLKWGRL
jgi:hypothetical protein